MHSVVFAGTPAFAVPSLRALIDDPRFDVRLVITQPDKPAGRGKKLTPPPVKVTALEHNVPVAQPEDINNSQLSIINYQFLVVVAYGQILSPQILAQPQIAPVNLHASLLPRWRGASPIQHAILAGDAETGVTVQRMVEALDAGPILGQKRMAIGPRETAATLHDRLAAEGARVLIDVLTHPLQEMLQDEAQATVCRKIRKADGAVDPAAMTAEEIDRRIRAFTPWPGVTATIDGSPLKLLEASLDPEADALTIACRDGNSLSVTRVQPPGGKPMGAAEWARGHRG